MYCPNVASFIGVYTVQFDESDYRTGYCNDRRDSDSGASQPAHSALFLIWLDPLTLMLLLRFFRSVVNGFQFSQNGFDRLHPFFYT